MSSSGQKRLPATERRAVILEAAGRQFGEHGYDAARLDDIAAAAGVTKPVLYRHFESKQALYLALLARHRDDLATFIDLIPRRGTVAERVRPVLETWLIYVERRAYAWRMLFRDPGGGDEIAAVREQVHARARGALVDALVTLGAGSIPRRELEPIAELMSMGMASVVLWWIDEPAVGREAVIDAITRVWVGLAPDRGG